MDDEAVATTTMSDLEGADADVPTAGVLAGMMIRSPCVREQFQTCYLFRRSRSRSRGRRRSYSRERYERYVLGHMSVFNVDDECPVTVV